MNTFKNIDIKKLFDIGYIFEKVPDTSGAYKYLIFLFGLMILLAVLAWFGYGRLKKKLPLWEKMETRVFNIFFYIGITGLLLIFFRWQAIPFLGSRFFMILLALVFIIWGLYIIYFRLRVLPSKIADFEREKNFKKYLPRPAQTGPRRPASPSLGGQAGLPQRKKG